MRWTIRGVSIDGVNSVRQLAQETGCSLGQILSLCIEFGLEQARDQLEEDVRRDEELRGLWAEFRSQFEVVRTLLEKAAEKCGDTSASPSGERI